MPAARHRRGARRNAKTGETWDETVARVHAQFPSTAQGKDWWYEQLESRQLRDALLYDVLNVGLIEETGGHTRRGSRPPLDYRVAMEELRKLRGEDFTNLPFCDAFQVLVGDRSLRHIASRCELGSHMQVRRLLTGTIVPSGEEMEKVARAFRKRPSYFREYRTAVVCALTYRLLVDDPERSAVIIQQLTAIR